MEQGDMVFGNFHQTLFCQLFQAFCQVLSLFPYLFLSLLAVGLVWLFALWARSPRLIQVIEQDLEASHAKFSPQTDAGPPA
jgi:hypothetical protein